MIDANIDCFIIVLIICATGTDLNVTSSPNRTCLDISLEKINTFEEKRSFLIGGFFL